MRVGNKNYRTVWMEQSSVFLIEQNLLPYQFKIYESKNYLETCNAISTMIVRGAGAIGVTAGFAMAQAVLEAPSTGYEQFLTKAREDIEATRPTAQNLFMATERVYNAAQISRETALNEAFKLSAEDAESSRKIGEYGNTLIEKNYRIATHCNAGWLAFVDYGTALSPVYLAHHQEKNVFVYVDETRPRSQGARLTAWELKNEQVPHQIIPDNACAYLMAQNKVDMMIVGADRIARNGDVANKIGTLEKAIAAKEFGIPFYVAAPLSTFDLKCESGSKIPIEERSEEEVLFQTGPDENGEFHTIQTASPGSSALNIAFDVTPAKYITGIITDKGIIKPDKVLTLF